MKKKFYNLFPLTLILLGCICSESCLTAMHCGIDLCIKQLIPALYLFLIAANLFYILPRVLSQKVFCPCFC